MINDIDEANREIDRLRVMLAAQERRGEATFALHIEHDRSNPEMPVVRYVITGPADREDSMARAFEGIHQSVSLHASQLHGEALATRTIVAFIREFAEGDTPADAVRMLADAIEAGAHRAEEQ